MIWSWCAGSLDAPMARSVCPSRFGVHARTFDAEPAIAFVRFDVGGVAQLVLPAEEAVEMGQWPLEECQARAPHPRGVCSRSLPPAQLALVGNDR